MIDEEAGKIEVVVPDEQLSLAIGRRGQNVRLASQLTGLDIDIMTEADESARRQAEFAERTNLFMETLDIDEMMAQLLVSEGFTNLEEVAYVDLDELLSIDGFDEATAAELQARARDNLEAANKKALETAIALGRRGQPDQLRGADAADAGSAGARTTSRRWKTSRPAPTGNWPAAGPPRTASARRTRACSRSST